MSKTWIDKLNADNGRLHKEEVLKQALAMAKLGNEISKKFLFYIRACYNPYVTFGVKNIPSTVGITGAANDTDAYTDLLEKLASRELTGNDAKEAILEVSEKFDSEEWNTFYAPVLRRDLRAGISATTINKIVKKTEYEIPVFSCQLATNCEGRPEMAGIKRLEPKLDGVRVLMVVQGIKLAARATCYSRNGKPFENFSHIEDQILRNILEITEAPNNIQSITSNALVNGFVLDGEIVGNSFQELMRQARRKEDVQAEDSVFHVFDIIPLEDFNRGYWNAQLSKRIELLEALKSVIDTLPNVELLPHIEVDLDTHEGKAHFERYCKSMVNAGFEGAMIKDLNAPYVCKRSTFWMKYKPTITVDLQIVGVEEGTGRNLGRLGALVCCGVDDGKEITVNVGSGFSDDEREEFWALRALLLGRTVEILADAITQNQDGTYSLRFPRFLRFRDDK